MSKTWPSLVFVSQKYCAEKMLIKTHVAVFMKVTVDLFSFLPLTLALCPNPAALANQ
jgi:hypothetical protein